MERINYIIGDESQLKQMAKAHSWKPFDERVINFCGRLSDALMKARYCQNYPDLVTLAFWLRKSNIQKIRQGYHDLPDVLGRGLVFHIAPGNIALSYAYSMITGLLTGNVNVIRMSSRRFGQSDIFCNTLRVILQEETEIARRVCLIQYSHDKGITDGLSAKCHMRVIWGGDSTINAIRQSPIPPRTTEITFANRFSICLINAENYLADYDPRKTAHDFYIDTYLSDQNACSSPRIVFWMGERIAEAKEVFWSALSDEIRGYQMAPVTTVGKLLTFCKFAAENRCGLATGPDYRIMRVNIESLSEAVLGHMGNSGYFYEHEISDLEELLPICTWELQTVSHIGFESEKLREFVLSHASDGVDRIVPVGRTMDFSLIWDGHDVIREMTREVSVYR